MVTNRLPMAPELSPDVFHAVADVTRRAILDQLRNGAKPVHQIASEFPVSRPAISKHLRVLHQANLVRERREGRRRLYHLNPEPLRSVDDWLRSYRDFWAANLLNLKKHVEEKEQRK
jgi:DNA-binding transcriptional ArsR family regulator